jgi:hypothetical protein
MMQIPMPQIVFANLGIAPMLTQRSVATTPLLAIQLHARMTKSKSTMLQNSFAKAKSVQVLMTRCAARLWEAA